MSTFVLVPGAGGAVWYWSRVIPLLQVAGHQALAVDLPGDDENAGLTEYVRLVAAAIGDHDEVILVAQSLGGFVSPMVCNQAPVCELVFVNAMIPAPGETAGAWWDNTGSNQAREVAARAAGYGADFDADTYFLHDVPVELVAEGESHQREQANAVFESACDFAEWPAIPIRVLVGAGDRFFPADFQRRVTLDRLGLEPDLIPGGHLLALSQPDAVADYLLRR
ncbi:alpha/beta hydrolase [Cryobacterium roopkundense]|uniref:Alpha/beta hydrolase n=1 Tax=Cryobacterium roopkundense TaxID=1001240 RepID=A0A099JL68_9MICO|nr:alpha/beta hydrolase [Cryobacterium roopkundense]KGJ78372.1 alpha/beta hydrolase [Cryobacterium roopkundense]MBB5639992.1 pimeloyl-ACP methyl ester carboxylesterase [Cryobacterium roopkundense]